MKADDKTVNELTEEAGEIGAGMAESIAEKTLAAVDGFPAATHQQKVAIVRLISHELHGYVEEKSA